MKNLLFLFVLLPFLAFSQNNTQILSSTEITVKQGHNEQFMDAVKKWKACYIENNGEEKWNFWRRIQGEGNVYIMTSVMENWAEMDEKDEASKECYRIVLNDILPHVEKTNDRFSRTMPEFSMDMDATPDMDVIWVTYYKVNNSDDFKEIIKDVSAAIKAKEGSHRAWWYSNIGGPSENPDYFVSTPFKNYAAMDIERDSPAKIYEDAVGEKKSAEMITKWRATVDDSWSYILSLNKDLSSQ